MPEVPVKVWPIALLIVAALAGCAGDDESTDKAPGPDPDAPALQGWVFDEAVRPIPGVQIVVLEQEGLSMSTNADGYYSFVDVPRGETLFLAASMAGYEPQTKQVTLHPELGSTLNFTLARIPEKTPFTELYPFDGFIACQYAIVIQEDAQVTDCGGEGANIDRFQFAVGPDLAGVVIEIAWEPGNDLSDSFYAAVFGDGVTEPIAEAVGGSILRLQVPEQMARDRFAAGGVIEVFVQVMPNVDEEEANTGVGLAVNQEFEVFGTAFYVDPPSPTYTVAG